MASKRPQKDRLTERAGSVDRAIEQLSTELDKLLIEKGSLELNSLWNEYRNKYKKLPDLQDFIQLKVKKRSELLGICPSVRIENGCVHRANKEESNPQPSAAKGHKKIWSPLFVPTNQQAAQNQKLATDPMARNLGYGPPQWRGPAPRMGIPQFYPQQNYYEHAFPGPPGVGNFEAGHHGHHPRSRQYASSVSKEELKSVLQDCIDRLAEAKEYVSVDKIERLVLEHFKISHLGEIGLARLENYNVVNEHNRKLGKVNAFIQAYMLARSSCTLHELLKDLEEFCCNGQPFETLKIGPLQKQPLIWTFFKFPIEKEIPTLTMVDLIEHLRGFLNANNAWTSQALNVVQFIEYLANVFGEESGFHLGVRVRSLPLLTQVLKRAQKEAANSIRNTCTAMNMSVSTDITTAFQQLRNSLVNVEDGPCTVRQEYLSMATGDVFAEICSKMIVLLDSLKFIHEQCDSFTGILQRDYNKSIDVMKKFQKQIRSEKLFCLVFQFAVCTSREEMHRQLQDLLENTVAEIKPKSETVTKESSAAPPPPVDKLVEMSLVYLDRCLLHGSLSLSMLSQIENKLLEDFNNRHFSSLGQGPFLKFIQTNETVKKRLDECGGTSLGSGGGNANRSMYQPSQQDILHFISQTSHSNAPMDLVEKALCHHYNAKNLKDLGKGTISHLNNILERTASAKHHSVIYEGSLCVKTSSSWIGKNRQVGILGHKAKDQALACLQNCPLLEDLAEWSHWDLVFQPELGELKDFVHKYGGVHTTNFSGSNGPAVMTTNLMALETKPGQLLKITCDTSPDKFLTSAQQENVVDTCGHLVSLIIANKGVDGTPLALLGNHIKTALFTMQAGISDVPGAPGCPENTKSVRFVLECLLKVPLLLCQAIATQVFLEPLSSVIGAAKSKELLQKLCRNSSEESRLQLLGCLLGIQDWVVTFDQKCVPPAQCLESLADPVMQDVFQEPIEVDSDAEDMKDEPEVFTLSDDSSDEDEDMRKPNQQVRLAKVKQESMDTVVIESSTTDSEVVTDSEVEIMPDLSTKEQNCWQIVEKIRREEFGVDVKLSEDGQKLMLKQNERLGRSLDRLSKDLYSKDTHFVLELIQNADDNDYAAEQLSGNGSECPAVEFVVERDSVSVMNNELGFEENNIRAICDVGKSTKGKHKYGYIGQKGIGFKSVFRVTDTPMIHSNGYHIKFDVNSGPMGYILPHWVADAEMPSSTQSWKTSIILPLRKEFQTSVSSQSMAARFQDIHPSLLLFLHRLKRVSINNKVDKYFKKMHRKDLGNHMTEIKHSNGTDRWLVVRKTLDASSISLQAKSGVEVESTEIAMAFPINQEIKDKRVHVNLQKQPVFAFLPLRSYGFRFIIQGDFDVPASREDVDKDSLWNQWLRTELHTLFADVMDIFKTHPDLNGLAGLAYFMNFIPLEDEILDFFRPVASNILQYLRSKPCLPAQPNENGAVEWKLPSQLVFCTDRLLREVMTSDDIQQHLGLCYLHEEIIDALNPSLVENLGIQKLQSHHLIEVAKGITHSLCQDDMIDMTGTITRIAKLLACVYRLSDDLHSEDELRQLITEMPIMPLSTGEFVSLSTTAVFFPVAMETGPRSGYHAGPRHGFIALQKDLRTLHPLLFSSLDEVANLQVGKFLENLGAKRFTQSDVVHYHIVPTFKSDAWKEKSEELLVDYLMFVKDALEHQPSLVNMEDLKSIVVLKTNKGSLRPIDQHIHFSSAYGLSLDLPKTFPRCDWTVIDNCYIERIQQTPAAVRSWVVFLTKLGMYTNIAVERKTVTLKPEDWDSSPWASYQGLLPDVSSTYQVKDFTCDEFKLIVDTEGSQLAPNVKHQRLSCLFKLLDDNWDDYQCYTMGVLEDSHGNQVRQVPSSFGIHLETLPWVPAFKEYVAEEPSGRCNIIKETFSSRGSDLFMPVLDIRNLLAHHVPYFNAPARSPSLLLKHLKVRQSVDVEFMKEKFKEWAMQQEKQPDRAESRNYLFTSLSHIKKVYSYLQDNLPPKQLQDLLIDSPFVFLPNPQMDLVTMQDMVVAGRLLRRQQVRWKDPTGLFQKYTESLENANLPSANKTSIHHLYTNLQEFFLRSGRVEEEPEIDDYVALLKHLTSSYPVSQVLLDVHQIFSTLGAMLSLAVTDPDQAITVVRINSAKAKLKSEAIIPVKDKKWVKLSDEPMIADDRQLERMFASRGEAGVHFVETTRRTPKTQIGTRFSKPQRPKEMAEQEEYMIHFLEAFGVKKLSNCVNLIYRPEMFYPCPELQQYVRNVVPYVQRDLLTEYPHIYEQLKAKGVVENLPKTVFGRVDTLEVVYSLKHLPDETAKTSTNCRFTDNNEFYVLAPHIENYSEINGELARYFSCGDNNARQEIRTLLIEILPLVQNDNSRQLEDLLRRNDITELPEGEEPWNVPEPVFLLPEQDEEKEAMDFEDGDADDLLVNFKPKRSNSSGAVASWPPKSSQLDPKVVSGYQGTRPPPIWPPPAPPPEIVASDFSHLRPARDDLVQMRQDAERNTSNDGAPRSSSSSEQSAYSGLSSRTGLGHRGSGEHHSQGPHHAGPSSGYHHPSDGHLRENHSQGQRSPHSDRTGHSEGPGGQESDSPLVPTDGHSPGAGPSNSRESSSPRDGSPNFTPKVDGRKRPRMESEGGHDQNSGRLNQSSLVQSGVWFDPPIWKGDGEIPYEEVGQGDKLNYTTLPALPDNPESDSIGRWGEAIVHEYLQSHFGKNSDVVKIRWMNEQRETGSPYDMEIHFYDEETQTTDTLYIEVKATLLDKKAGIQISAKEVKFALDQQEKYLLYRVYNVGNTESVRMTKLENLAKHLNEGIVKLFMVV